MFKMFKSRIKENATLRFNDEGFDGGHSASTPKNEKKHVSFETLPQSEFIFNDPGLNDYAERWGSASVNATRFFILAAVGMASAAVLGVYSLKTASEQKSTNILVEYNGQTGEYKKPVVIETMTATDAMAKYAMARWAEWVFTLDPKLSYNYLLDADAMSKGRARGQFAEYRLKTEVIRHIKEMKRLVFAKTLAVDILAPGVAVLNVETTEVDQSGASIAVVQYRVRLDYSINPPKEASVALRNPIGLEVENFSYERLAK